MSAKNPSIIPWSVTLLSDASIVGVYNIKWGTACFPQLLMSSDLEDHSSSKPYRPGTAKQQLQATRDKHLSRENQGHRTHQLKPQETEST